MSHQPHPVPATEHTEAWLADRRLTDHTRAAYRRDVTSWLTWCADHAVGPLRATVADVNAYARHLHARRLAPASVARKLSGVSGWYDYLVRLQVVTTNPVGGADRPHIDRDHSTTRGLSPDQVDALLTAADAAGPRHHAMITMLADLGLRVGELVGLDLTDVGRERGHRTVRFTGRGGKARRRALTPAAATTLDDYLRERGRHPGPLFATASGARVDRHAVFRLVRRLAADAGIADAGRLSPHSLRHTFATSARAEGVPLADVQDAMGHADPRTTRRYDRDRFNLDRDPAYTIAAARARRNNP
jgi:integrase/recombinase XerD